MACKSRSYALEKSAQRQFATHVGIHNRDEVNRRTRIFAAEKVPALRLYPCYSSIDTASPLSARLIPQYRIDRPLLSSDTPTAAQILIASLFLSGVVPCKNWQTKG
jgi:hypothetical protein